MAVEEPTEGAAEPSLRPLYKCRVAVGTPWLWETVRVD
jgi:hypothetical protein